MLQFFLDVLDDTTVPDIDLLTPNHGQVGSSVTIDGADFGVTQDISIVTIDGILATVSSWSNLQIIAVVPVGATGTADVIVTVGGNDSNTETFTVDPTILPPTPNSGHVGGSITITGASFGATQGASTITLNGVTMTVTAWSDTSITATVPNTNSGNIIITVGGTATNSWAFAVVGGASGTQVWNRIDIPLKMGI